MMKKLIVIAVMLLLVLSLVACNTETEPTVTPAETTTGTPEATPEATLTAEATPTPTPTPTPTATPTPEKADPAVVLKDKVAYFFGDSICHAGDDNVGVRGWAGRIINNYGMHNKASKNCGVSGASVSTIRGTNTVYNQVIQNRIPLANYVILEGGVNDAWDSCPVGTMVEASAEETDISSLDLSTFAGGLEQLLYQVKKQYPKAKIGYIICFKMGVNYGRLGDMTEYVEMTKKICDKWGVPYLNLYEDKAFNTKFLIKLKKNAVDGCHPNENGYDLLAPVIAEFMAEIAVG